MILGARSLIFHLETPSPKPRLLDYSVSDETHLQPEAGVLNTHDHAESGDRQPCATAISQRQLAKNFGLLRFTSANFGMVRAAACRWG